MRRIISVAFFLLDKLSALLLEEAAVHQHRAIDVNHVVGKNLSREAFGVVTGSF